jgi:hypothetical protein
MHLQPKLCLSLALNNEAQIVTRLATENIYKDPWKENSGVSKG